MNDVSHHLLRTLAAVPVDSSVLLLGCSTQQHPEALLRLGFPIHVCDPDPDVIASVRETIGDLIDAETAERCTSVGTLDALSYPDDTFDWVVADRAEALLDAPDDLAPLMAEAKRMLAPGGWLYVTLPAHPDDVEDQDRTAGDGAPVAATPDAGEESLDPSDADADGAVRIETLEARRADAGLAESVRPEVVDDGSETLRLRAIYRHVTQQTTG